MGYPSKRKNRDRIIPKREELDVFRKNFGIIMKNNPPQENTLFKKKKIFSFKIGRRLL